MKKCLFFLVLILSWSEANGQLYPPIQPYRESGYSANGFESFALRSTALSSDYRHKVIQQVNSFLKETGLYEKYNGGQELDEAWISWIFSPIRTWKENRIYPNGFWNSHQSRDGNEVVYYWDKSYFCGPILTLHLDGCGLDLGKDICTNLVKVPYTISRVIERPKVEPVVSEIYTEKKVFDDWNTVEPERKVEVPRLAVKKQKNWLVAGIVGFVSASALATGAYFLLNRPVGNPGGSPVTPDRGGPGGAPVTPPVTPPGDTGGPGGAPTTK